MSIGMMILLFLVGVFVISIIVGISVARAFKKDDTKNWFAGGVGIFGTWFVLLILAAFLKPWGYVENYEIGYRWDARTGKIEKLDKIGYVARQPVLQSIYTIDPRPQQVCITANTSVNSGVNARVLNCKLVQFNPEGLDLFLKWHGAADYSGETLRDLLKIYAYDNSGTTYPFITIMNELKGTPQNIEGAAPPVTVPSPVPTPAMVSPVNPG